MKQTQTDNTRKRKRPRRRVRPRTVIKFAAAALLLSLALGIFVLVFFFDAGDWEKFDPDKLENVSQRLMLYDKDANEVAGLRRGENRTLISLRQIPQHVQDALLAIEDVRFYSHFGIDVRRIFGSLVSNIKSGEIVAGASTINQQLIKLTHLTPEQTMTRKLQEAWLAIQLDRRYDKEKILEMYFNIVYFGHGAYGIEAAAQAYFGIGAQDLSIAQGAQLVGILKGTGIYAPHINPEKSLQRRDLVLRQMLKYGFITETQYQNALAEPMELKLSDAASSNFGYYVDAALEEATRLTGIAYDDMVSGGYRIYTTLDTQLQGHSETLMRSAEYFPEDAGDGTPVQGALVVLDAQTGAVRSLVGGRQYESRLALNRAIHARRQPGSAIKPLVVYAPAIENFNYTPATLLLDEKADFNGYSPSNSGDAYLGWITLRTALARSKNIPAVRVLQDIGVSAGKAFASRLDIPFDAQDTSLTLALGGFTRGVTPLEMAQAYTMVAAQGRYSPAYFVEKVIDRDGRVLYGHQSISTQVMSPGAAFLLADVLRDTVAEGTGTRLQAAGVPLAAKTGTVQYDGKYNRDAWVAACNPEYVSVCWMGFDKTDSDHKLSSSVQGGRQPAVLVADVFAWLYQQREAVDFLVPDTVQRVTIDLRALTERHQLFLASDLTPAEYRLDEYFLRSNMPTTQSDYWILPESPELHLALSDNELPLLSFFARQDFAQYQVYRAPAEGQAVLVHTLQGAPGDLLAWEDAAATPGIWQYYVVPVHAQLQLAGNPSDTLTVEVPAPILETPEPEPSDLSPEFTPTPPPEPTSTAPPEPEEDAA